MMIRRLICVVLLLAALPAEAAKTTAAQQEYYKAVGLDRKGQSKDALARLDRIAAENPEDRFADDALFRGAEICERKLLDLPGALTRYQTLLESYPRSRLFRRAQTRHEYLSANRGAGDEVLLRFEKLLRETPLSDLERTRKTMGRLRELLAANPDFPQTARATYWIAEAQFKLKQEAEAFATLADLAERFPDTDWAMRSRLRTGDALLARRDYRQAAESYAAAGPKAASSLRRAETWVQRQRVATGGLVLFVAFVLLLLLRAPVWRMRGRDLWPLPGEVVFLAPVVLLMAVLGRANSAVLWVPVALLCGGGLLATGASAISFRRRAPSRTAGLVWTVFGVLAGLGFAYAVIYHYNLMESVVHTWEFGTD